MLITFMIISFILLILFIIQLGNVKQNPNSQKFESENISKKTSNISQKTKIATLNTDVFKVAKNNKVKSNKIISNKVTNISNLKFNEILVLDYFKNKTTTKEAPISKLNDFGKNYKQTLDKLISMNYLQLANIVDEIKYFTIPVLKNILKTKSLNISGNKNTLLERILNNFSEQELLKYINERHYILTKLGTITLKNNELYILNYNIAKYSFNELKQYELQIKNNIKGLQPIEILYAFAQKKTIDYAHNHDYNLLRYNFKIECICADKLKYDTHILRNNLRLIIFDLSGLTNLTNNSKFYVKPYKTNFISTIPVNNIKKVIKTYNISDKTIYNILVETINIELGYLPFHYFSQNSLLNILSSCIYGEIPDLKKIQPDFLPPKEWSIVLKFD